MQIESSYQQIPISFDVKEVLDLPHGAVMIDLQAIDAIYAAAQNSTLWPDFVSKVKTGDIIPVTADALSDYSVNHALLHIKIDLYRIPAIPMFTSTMGQPVVVRSYMPPVIPNVWVRKRSGSLHSHGGNGISIERTDRPALDFSKQFTEFLQPFILPPVDSQGERRMADHRVYMVGGKPVIGVTRRAKKALTPDIITGDQIPDTDYFPLAGHDKDILLTDDAIWPKVADRAELIGHMLSELMGQYQQRLFSPLSTLGFASMDFLLDAHGEPLLVDFDLNPSAMAPAVETLATALAEELDRLSQALEQDRSIVIIGDEFRELTRLVLEKLNENGAAGKVMLRNVLPPHLLKHSIQG